MRKIISLSPHIISRIAAGEVIERPAYAVKEIIENSIDAKATIIKVEIEDGGLKKIKATDNGEGMSEEDLLECYKSHTTSKLKANDSLEAIKFMGFRGEALSSIASVSDMTINSRTKDTIIGNGISLQGGIIEKTYKVGMPSGTSISIENLFYTVPARKKFLKKESTETRHIAQVTTDAALAFPKVSFQLTNRNSRTTLNFSNTMSHAERIRYIIGEHMYENLIPMEYTNEYFTLSGFISKPQISSKHSAKNYIFINKRRVSDKIIAAAIKRAYGTLLEPTAHPFFILYVDIPFEMVDVNIHPRKEQVNILTGTLLTETLLTTVTNVLSKTKLTYSDLRWRGSASYERSKEKLKPMQLREGNTNSYAASILKKEIIPWDINDASFEINSAVQLHSLYIVAQTSRGLMIVDQHAAHERILYQQYLEKFNELSWKKEKHIFTKPIIIPLSLEEKEILKENNEILKNIGFDITEKKEKIYISSIPKLFIDRDISELMRDVLEDLDQDSLINKIDTKTQRMLAYLACRNAIKAGDALTNIQAKNLIEKLAKTKNSFTCPHGRPTHIEVTLDELNRMFKR